MCIYIYSFFLDLFFCFYCLFIETGTLWECTFFHLLKDVLKALSQRTRIVYKQNHETCITCKYANTKQRYSVCPDLSYCPRFLNKWAKFIRNNNRNPPFKSIGTLFKINRRRKVNRKPLNMNWRPFKIKENPRRINKNPVKLQRNPTTINTNQSDPYKKCEPLEK